MDEVNVLLDSIERIYSNIESIENDSFKNNFNKYVLIKSTLDSYRDRLDICKNKLKVNRTDGIKEEINSILSELLGEENKEDVIEVKENNTEFNIEDSNVLLESMPDVFEPNETETIEESEPVFENISEDVINPIMEEVTYDEINSDNNSSDVIEQASEPDVLDGNEVNNVFIEEPLQEEIIPQEDHIEETEFIEPIDEINNLEEEMIDIPTFEEIRIPEDEFKIPEVDEINLDELNSMIETFE